MIYYKSWIPIRKKSSAIDGEDARQVLSLASLESMSVHDLEQELEISAAAIYRHTDDLTEVEFLRKETEITPDGDHYSTFETSVRSITFTITRGEFNVDIEFRDDIVDRFSRLWRSFGEESQ